MESKKCITFLAFPAVLESSWCMWCKIIKSFYIALPGLTPADCRQELQCVGAVPIPIPTGGGVTVGPTATDLFALFCECVPVSRASCGPLVHREGGGCAEP